MLITKLHKIGLTPTDIHNLEYLEDKEVLAHLPGGFCCLKKNVREDVVLYFETFADLLEEKLLRNIELPADLFNQKLLVINKKAANKEPILIETEL